MPHSKEAGRDTSHRAVGLPPLSHSLSFGVYLGPLAKGVCRPHCSSCLPTEGAALLIESMDQLRMVNMHRSNCTAAKAYR